MKRFRLWNEWRKNCLNHSFHKIMVLFGIIHSPTFTEFKAIRDLFKEVP